MPDFCLPDLGEGLTEAEIIGWRVQVGDEVSTDQVVVEVETAKAAVEVPVPFAGRVETLHARPGQVVPVGAPLITVTPAGAAAAGLREPGVTTAPPPGPNGPVAGGSAAGGAATTTPAAAPAPNGVAAAAEPGPAGGTSGSQTSGNVLVGYGTPAGSARRRRHVRPARRAAAMDDPLARPAGAGARQAGVAAPEAGVAAREVGVAAGEVGVAAGEVGREDLPAAPGARPDGRPIPPVPALLAPSGRPRGPVPVISPLVRKMARDAGVDLAALAGSGPSGLVLRRDVDQAIQSRDRAVTVPAGAPAVATPAGGPVSDGGERRIPLRGVRKAVADKLTRSRREIPEATVWVDVDATDLLAARAAMNARQPDRPVSVLALVARFAVLGLRRYPELNGRVEADEIVLPAGVQLGFAAQTDRGLVVPVVRDAHLLSARELSAAIAGLTDAARAGTAGPAELTGGTFTVNNYGVFGVDGSAAIINHPEVAILGLGRIIDRPWVVDGAVAVRKLAELTLAFDHRVCDGGTAGGFLRFVADCIESPVSALADL